MPEQSRIALVLVYFDDTLVDTAPRFSRGRTDLFALLETLGFNRETIERVHHDEVDAEMIKRHGFGPYRLEPSFRETYLRLCRLEGRSAESEVLEQCRRLALGVAGTPPCLDGAVDALVRLSAVLRTVIYTQSGDPDYQLACVRDSGIMDVVTPAHVHVAAHKTTEAFRAALDRFGIADPATAWMVGNSMRSDVNPALEAGANAILVEQAEPWHFDVVEPFSPGFHRAPTFSHAADFLLAGRAG